MSEILTFKGKNKIFDNPSKKSFPILNVFKLETCGENFQGYEKGF